MEKIYVDKQYIGIRLDRYLRVLYPKLTQGIIESCLRNKKIKVNYIKIM